MLLVLTVGTSIAAYVAFQQRNRAESRALAVHAIEHLGVNPEISLQWATQAMTTALTSEAETALRGSLFASRPQAKIYLSGYRHDNPTWTVAFSTDSQRIVATSAQEGFVKVVRLDTDEEDSRIRSVNGRAFTNGDLVLTVKSTGKAELWDVGRGSVMRILSENLRDPTRVAFSPNGNLVFANAGKNFGTIWEVNSGNSRELDRSAGQVTQAVFSPDGQFLVTVSQNRQAQLWDSDSGH